MLSGLLYTPADRADSSVYPGNLHAGAVAGEYVFGAFASVNLCRQYDGIGREEVEGGGFAGIQTGSIAGSAFQGDRSSAAGNEIMIGYVLEGTLEAYRIGYGMTFPAFEGMFTVGRNPATREVTGT